MSDQLNISEEEARPYKLVNADNPTAAPIPGTDRRNLTPKQAEDSNDRHRSIGSPDRWIPALDKPLRDAPIPAAAGLEEKSAWERVTKIRPSDHEQRGYSHLVKHIESGQHFQLSIDHDKKSYRSAAGYFLTVWPCSYEPAGETGFSSTSGDPFNTKRIKLEESPRLNRDHLKELMAEILRPYHPTTAAVIKELMPDLEPEPEEPEPAAPVIYEKIGDHPAVSWYEQPGHGFLKITKELLQEIKENAPDLLTESSFYPHHRMHGKSNADRFFEEDQEWARVGLYLFDQLSEKYQGYVIDTMRHGHPAMFQNWNLARATAESETWQQPEMKTAILSSDQF